MERLLKSQRGRVFFLNVGLLGLFALAWLSDLWPNWSSIFIALGVFLIFVQAILLYRFARRVKVNIENKERRDLEDFDAKVSLTARISVPALKIGGRDQKALLEPESLDGFNQWLVRLYSQRVTPVTAYRSLHYPVWPALDSNASLPQPALLNAEIARRILDLPLARTDRHKLLASNTELAKWKLKLQGEESFSVKAGDFEIEHFHGRTNIRVLNSSRVTVEGESRGQKIKLTDDSICVPVYQ